MKDVISREILGAPVMVKIGDRECQLTYPVHNIFLYRQLTGDSLFARDNWHKIDFEEKYENWIACLWAGLHLYDEQGGVWKAPITRAQLEQSIGFVNAASIHNAMVTALTAWMPKKKEGTQPAEGAPDHLPKPKMEVLESSGSGLPLASD